MSNVGSPHLLIDHVSSLLVTGGGLAESVPSLCLALHELGHSVRLHTLSEPSTDLAFPTISYPPSRPRKLQGSRTMKTALRDASARTDIYHGHGIWALGNFYPQGRTDGAAAYYVLSPRGMLEPQAMNQRRWRKRMFWLAHQQGAIAQADLLHATSATERDSIRRLGFSSPIALIPNGVALPPAELPSVESESRELVVLSLGRLHPQKGLVVLLKAWAEVAASSPGWRLVVAGPDERNHRRELEVLSSRLNLSRVELVGPVYGREKAALFAKASLFVLPSFSESFAMVVAEALSYGVPVVASQGAPWSRLRDMRCGWWVDATSSAMAGAIREAVSLPRSELAAMGNRGRIWMQREFSWERVAEMMVASYTWLRNRDRPPDWVEL